MGLYYQSIFLFTRLVILWHRFLNSMSRGVCTLYLDSKILLPFWIRHSFMRSTGWPLIPNKGLESFIYIIFIRIWRDEFILLLTHSHASTSRSYSPALDTRIDDFTIKRESVFFFVFVFSSRASRQKKKNWTIHGSRPFSVSYCNLKTQLDSNFSINWFSDLRSFAYSTVH